LVSLATLHPCYRVTEGSRKIPSLIDQLLIYRHSCDIHDARPDVGRGTGKVDVFTFIVLEIEIIEFTSSLNISLFSAALELTWMT